MDGLPGLVAGLLSQHGTRIISFLCSVTAPTVKRWAKGDTAPSRANVARLLFVKMTTRMISYRYSERVATSWLTGPNPWLCYHAPVQDLASSDPGSSEWDAVAQAATRFTFGEIQNCVCACEVSPSQSTPATQTPEERGDSDTG